VINGPPRRSPQAQVEDAKTERAAIKGWGPTLRLLIIRTAPTIVTIILALIFGHQMIWTYVP
jgi:hypothetical protein